MDYPFVQILGVRFIRGTAADAVATMKRNGGLLIVPAAPAFVRWRDDENYRRAIANADLAIPDSGLMVLTWRLLRGEKLNRISGLAYLKELVRQPLGSILFVLPSAAAQTKLLTWAPSQQLAIGERDCYVAPKYDALAQDRHLLALVEDRHPAHIIIAIGNGPQEKLGAFLRDNFPSHQAPSPPAAPCTSPSERERRTRSAGEGDLPPYRPAIHCIGAALGFLTGEQVAIPNWADRFYLGWLFRLLAQPRIFVPRLARALELPWLMLRYGRDLPPVTQQSRK